MKDNNDFTPEFDSLTYTSPDILETTAPGTIITEVRAVDGDTQV